MFQGVRKVYELEAGQPQDHLVNLDTGEISHLPAQAMEDCRVAPAQARGVQIVRRCVTLYVGDSAAVGEPRSRAPSLAAPD